MIDQHDRSVADESVEDPTGLNSTPGPEEDRDPLDVDTEVDLGFDLEEDEDPSDEPPAPQLAGTEEDGLDPPPVVEDE